MRVGENLLSGGGVERSSFGILDARIEIECGLFGAAGIVDAVGAGKRVDVFVVEIEIAGQLAQLVRRGNSAEGIFRCDLREFERRLHQAVEACAGEVAGVGRGGALSEENADSDGAGAGFFEGFDLSEANQGGEFVAFADDAFGSGGSASHGAGDDVLGDFAEISFEFGVASFEFSLGHKIFQRRGRRGTRRRFNTKIYCNPLLLRRSGVQRRNPRSSRDSAAEIFGMIFASANSAMRWSPALKKHCRVGRDPSTPP